MMAKSLLELSFSSKDNNHSLLLESIKKNPPVFIKDLKGTKDKTFLFDKIWLVVA